MASSAFSVNSALIGTPADGSVTPVKIDPFFGGFLRNKIINGDFWEGHRGTSFSTPANGAYTLDRWRVGYDGTIGTFTVSQQTHTVGQTDVPDSPTYYLRWDHTSAGSGSTFRQISQRIEEVRTLANKASCLTFYAKADTTRTLTVSPHQSFGAGGSSDVDITPTSGATCSLTTSWQKFTTLFTPPSISGKTLGAGNYLGIRFKLPINTTMTIDISHVQVEVGSNPTTFEQMPIGLMTQQCHRYYAKLPVYVQETGLQTSVSFQNTMRVVPTVTGGGTGFTVDNSTDDGITCHQNSKNYQLLSFDSEL